MVTLLYHSHACLVFTLTTKLDFTSLYGNCYLEKENIIVLEPKRKKEECTTITTPVSVSMNDNGTIFTLCNLILLDCIMFGRFRNLNSEHI